MNANLAAILYLVSGVLFILALARPLLARLLAPGQSLRHDRHGDRRSDHAGAEAAVERDLVAARRSRLRHRRRDRRLARPHHPDDGDAAAGGDVPLAGRPRGGAGRGRRALCARGLRHRRGRRHPSGEHHRNVARPRDRRGDLHRLDHRLPEARRAHVGRADPAAAAPRDQHRPRRRARRADRALLRDAIAGVLLADHARLAGARRAADRPDRRRRHAGRHLDAELLFRLGGGGHRLHARQSRAHHHRRPRRLVGRDPLLHHVQGHEPLLHLGHPRRLRRRGRSRRRPARRRGRSSRARPRTRPS